MNDQLVPHRATSSPVVTYDEGIIDALSHLPQSIDHAKRTHKIRDIELTEEVQVEGVVRVVKAARPARGDKIVDFLQDRYLRGA